ncbi:MAG: hypothetical protein ACR2QE_11225 [Acidimicrobiales bacterium]
MSDTPPRRLPVVAVGGAVLAVVVVVWLVAELLGGDDSEPPAASLACLEGQHRPDPSGLEAPVVRLGVVVDGEADRYQVEIRTTDGGVLTNPAGAASGTPVVFPVSADGPEITITSITAIEMDEGGSRSDVTEQVLGVEPWEIEVPDEEGPIGEALACPPGEEPDVHPGYLFAAPTPTFGSPVPAEAEVADSVAQFMGEFGAAHTLLDAEFLVESLHPAVIEGFGDEICRAHIDASLGQQPPLTIDGVFVVDDYQLTRPGGRDAIDEVYLVEATATVAGRPVAWPFDLAVEDGRVLWLSWCGN